MAWLMLAVVLVARIALGLTYQSAGSATPYLMSRFDANLGDAGALVGIFMVPGIVLALPAGVLGARFGDKTMVLIGLAIMLAGSVMAAYAGSWTGLMIGRLVTGAGAVLLLVLMVKMAFDWFAGTPQLFLAISIFILGWPIGHALGQSALTVAAQKAGWPWAFFGAAVSCAVAALLLWACYRSPASATGRRQAPLSSLSRRELQLTTLSGLLWMVCNGAYVLVLALGPTVLTAQGISPVDAAHAASLLPWAFLVALPLGAWIATRWRIPNTVMFLSLVLSGVLCVWLALDASAPVFLGLGCAMAFGVAPIAALPSEGLRAEVRSVGLGWYYVWYFIGTAVFPALGGWIAKVSDSVASAMITAAIAQAVCLLLLVTFRRAQRRPVRGQERDVT